MVAKPFGYIKIEYHAGGAMVEHAGERRAFIIDQDLAEYLSQLFTQNLSMTVNYTKNRR